MMKKMSPTSWTLRKMPTWITKAQELLMMNSHIAVTRQRRRPSKDLQTLPTPLRKRRRGI